MTQEAKQLLLIDLCARLPYGVMCRLSVKGANVSITEKLEFGGLQHFIFGTMDVKPLLRPISSMTEEEEREFNRIFPCGMSFSTDCHEELIIYTTDSEYDGDHYFSCFVEIQDYLNAHHFDYRGLIKKGLALEALEGMYTKEDN